MYQIFIYIFLFNIKYILKLKYIICICKLCIMNIIGLFVIEWFKSEPEYN